MNSFNLEETLEEGEIEEDLHEDKQVVVTGQMLSESDDRTSMRQHIRPQKSTTERPWPTTFVYVKDDKCISRQPLCSSRPRFSGMRQSKSPAGQRERLRPRFARQFRPERQRPRHTAVERNKNPHDQLSYEDLLTQYKEIQSQLEELTQEEVSAQGNKLGKENVKSPSSHRSMINSRHNVPRSRSCRRIRSRSRSSANSSRSKSPHVKSADEDDEQEDEDEQELRRIALASARERKPVQKKSPEKRSQTEPQINITEEKLPTHLYDNYDQVAMEIDSNSSHDEEDEELLRSTLLMSMKQKKKHHVTSTNSAKATVVQRKQDTKVTVVANVAAPLHKPVVINLAEDSTDSEDDGPKLDKIPTVHASAIKKSSITINALQVQSRNSAKIGGLVDKNHRQLKMLRMALKNDEQELVVLKNTLTKKRALLLTNEQRVKQLIEQLGVTEKLVVANKAAVAKISNQIKVVQARTADRRTQIMNACVRLKLSSHQQTTLLKNERQRQELTNNHASIRKQMQISGNAQNMTSKRLAEEKARLERLVQDLAARLKDLRQKNGLSVASGTVSTNNGIPKTNVANGNQQTSSDITEIKVKTKITSPQKVKKCVNKNISNSNTQQKQLRNNLNNNVDRFTANSPCHSLLAAPHNLDLFVMDWPSKFNAKPTPVKCQDVVPVANPLSHLKASRFRTSFDGRLSSPTYAHKVVSDWVMCSYDLLGTCNDDHCRWQHAKDYTMSNQEIIIDIASYHLPVCGIDSQTSTKEMQSGLDVFAQNSFKNSSDVEDICRVLVEKINEANGGKIPLEARRLMPQKNVRESSKLLSEQPPSVASSNCQTTDAESSEMEMEDDDIPQRYFTDSTQEINKLETLLKNDSSNIDAWLQLAELQSNRHRGQNKSSLDRSLHILSRALESNRHSSRLWHRYLSLYERHSDDPHIIKLCEQAFDFAPSYQLGCLYLKYAVDVESKLNICDQLWSLLVSTSAQDPEMTPEIRSVRALEILLRQTELRIQKHGRNEDGVEYLEGALNTNNGNILLSRHSCLAWLALVHLCVWSVLPVTLFNGGRVIVEEPILISWSFVKSPELYLRILESALEASRSWFSDEDIFVIYWNLVEIHLACNHWQKAEEICKRAINSCPSSHDAWILLMKIFHIKSDAQNLLKTASEAMHKFASSPRIHFVVSLVTMKYGSHAAARANLCSLASNMCGGTLVEPSTCFRRMLNLSHSVLCSSLCLPTTDEGERVYLWLCYSLLLFIDNQDMTVVMDTALARVTSRRHLQLMWSFYLRIFAQTKSDKKTSWSTVFGRCLLANTAEFQSDLVDVICQSVDPDQRVSLVQYAHRCVPTNSNVLLRLLSVLFSQGNHADVVSQLRDAQPVTVNVDAAGLAITSALRVLPTHQMSTFCVDMTSLFPTEIALWEHAARTLDLIGQSDSARELRDRSPGGCLNPSIPP